MVEMKNSLVRDLPGILSAFSKTRNLVLHTTDTLKGQIELNFTPGERALLSGGG
jgi:hypothetical protein